MVVVGVGGLTMIRYGRKYGDLRGGRRKKTQRGEGGKCQKGRGQKTERRENEGGYVEDSEGEKGSAAARLIAVDLHDKRSRQLVTKVALRH